MASVTGIRYVQLNRKVGAGNLKAVVTPRIYDHIFCFGHVAFYTLSTRGILFMKMMIRRIVFLTTRCF